MKNVVWRPILVVLAIVGVILVARVFVVPKDFGVGPRGYRFSWHRVGNEQDWKKVEVKYQGSDYCSACHQDNYNLIMASKHKNIQCENCHGPAVQSGPDGKPIGIHPDKIDKLMIDRSRELCLRCHNANLAYPSSGREKMLTVDPDNHNPGNACVDCHNPHSPSF